MGTSEVGKAVLWLHAVAAEEGRIQAVDEQALAVLSAIARGTGESIGVEIYEGRPQQQVAKTIVGTALAELRRLAVVMQYVDMLGYTPLAVRALLRLVPVLKQSELDSETYAMWLDLQTAVAKCSERTQLIANALVAGHTVQEIETFMKVNANREIWSAVREIARHLEHKHVVADNI